MDQRFKCKEKKFDKDQEKTWVNFFVIWVGRAFLIMIPNPDLMREKIDTLDYLKNTHKLLHGQRITKSKDEQETESICDIHHR